MKRRDWLRTLGLAGLGLSLGGGTILRAQRRGPPLRFVAIITPNGTIGSEWGWRHGDARFRLGPILEPFEALRDRMLVVEGLHMHVARTGPGGGHQQGMGAILTGQPLLPGNFCGGVNCFNGTSGWAAGPSIDQEIAPHIASGARLRSLELGVRIEAANNRHRVSYRGADDPIPPDDDPFRVYERLFAGTGEDREAVRHRRRERGSVLDLARAELEDLEARIGSEQRALVDAHLTSIRELERELDREAEPSACLAPELPRHFDPRRRNAFARVSRLQLDLLAQAIACDATRVATVLYGGAASMQTFPWLDVGDPHHVLSHEPDTNLDAREKLVRIERWHAEEIARFASQLAAMPEGDGSVLDHTVILWGNEISVGNTHSHDDMHFVVLGGGRAGLGLGRWLDFRGRPHADLLLALAHAVGAPLARFGHPDFQTGPTTEIFSG